MIQVSGTIAIVPVYQFQKIKEVNYNEKQNISDQLSVTFPIVYLS